MIVVLGSMLFASPARASEPAARAAAPISGLSPLPTGCAPGAIVDAEEEPWMAVDPTDAMHFVAVWQQDRFAEHGGARSNVVGVTFNGGATWTSVTVPGISECTGGKYERASDPWVTIGPDGTVYMTTLAFAGGTSALDPSALLVSRSDDGGLTWGAPAVAVDDPALMFNDKQALTADPTRTGYVYLVWARFVGGVLPINYLSRSIDGGRTWLTPTPLPDTGQFNQIVVLPDGTLLDVYGVGTYKVMRSTNAGLTWSAPIRIGSADFGPAPFVRASASPDPAVAPDGTVYVTFPGPDRILIVKSIDGGRTWSPPRVVALGDWAMIPTAAVASDGAIGVSYYDFRNGNDSPGLMADFWFSSSRDGGQSWSEQHVSGPFDMTRAPYAQGFFVGDYEGMEAAGTKFVPVFVRPTPLDATSGVTDAYAAVLAAP